MIHGVSCRGTSSRDTTLFSEVTEMFKRTAPARLALPPIGNKYTNADWSYLSIWAFFALT